MKNKKEKEIYQMKTKSGFEFTVSFSDDPPDFSRLAKFFLLLAEKPNKISD